MAFPVLKVYNGGITLKRAVKMLSGFSFPQTILISFSQLAGTVKSYHQNVAGEVVQRLCRKELFRTLLLKESKSPQSCVPLSVCNG